MSKKPRPRTERREKERSLAKLREARERLFQVETGGAPAKHHPECRQAVADKRKAAA